jgi:hypothetical protein
VRRKPVELRSTDRAEQYRVRLKARVQSLLGKRVTTVFYGCSTDQPGREFKVVATNVGYSPEDLNCLGRNLRADSVARKNRNS